jgi:hypothetical protein
MIEIAPLWLAVGYLTALIQNRHRPDRTAKALGLIERAEADLRQGWVEAAQDALGRARALLKGTSPS